MAAEEEEIRTVTLPQHAGLRVTLVISSAVTLALILVFLMSGGGQQFLHRSAIIRTYFPDGTGLVRTADVQLAGIKVGTVRRVSLSTSTDPQRVVVVEMKIKTNYLRDIPVDSRTEITASNLLADKFINITRGQSAETIQTDSELTLHPPPENNYDPADLFASMQEILNRVNDLLALIENPDNPVGRFVLTDDFYNQLRDDVLGIQKSIHASVNPQSQLGQAIFGEDLYEQLRAPILSIDKLLADIQGGEGAIGHAYATTELYDQTRAAVKRLNDTVNSARGLSIVQTDELHDKLQNALHGLNESLDAMNNGEGAMGQLLRSEQLYDSLNGSSKSMEAFFKDFRQNPKKYLHLKLF